MGKEWLILPSCRGKTSGFWVGKLKIVLFCDAITKGRGDLTCFHSVSAEAPR